MAYICTKKCGCRSCEHFRLDEEEGRMACFAEIDEAKAKQAEADKE